MRIIDADILERSLTEIDEHINMDIFTNEVRELIDNAPTVKAIPLERVKQILSEIDLQLDEIGAYDLKVAKAQRYIRDKIKAIKEVSE